MLSYVLLINVFIRFQSVLFRQSSTCFLLLVSFLDGFENLRHRHFQYLLIKAIFFGLDFLSYLLMAIL